MTKEEDEWKRRRKSKTLRNCTASESRCIKRQGHFRALRAPPHLSLRMKEHCDRALAYATRMKEMGLKVVYPGLDDHPNHKLLKSLVNTSHGFGGMMCINMDSEERANRLMHHLQNSMQFGLMAVSLCYYKTLMSCSGSSTSSKMSTLDKGPAGISPGLVRMSVGYSGTLEQRWIQFKKALTLMQDGVNKN